MKTILLLTLLIFTTGAGLRAEAIPLAGASVAVHPGFVIRAQDRFDPAIQRLMAEHSLRSLPLQYGQLYYLYPIGVTPRIEGLQIRYLESLLDKEAARIAEEEAAAAEEEVTAEDGADRDQ